MPYLRVWIHMVWATKHREPLLTKKIRPLVFDHLRENAKKKGIYLDHVNGYVEHVHCLISMDATQNLATIANLLKGESAYWFNRQPFATQHFGWQDEYFAASVSHSHLDRVRRYIRNQEQHHARKTFQQEYDEFMDKYGFELMQGE